MRQFFDALVARHAAVLNPFRSDRGIGNLFGEERTPEVSVDTDHVFRLRDRAVFGTFVFVGVRVGALCRLRIQDLRDQGNHRTLQFAEKGGKVRDIPVRHDLDVWVEAWIKGAGLRQAPMGSALFRTGGSGRSLTDRHMSPNAVERVLKRRLRTTGLPEILFSHSFRILVVTDLLSQNVPLQDVQYLARHAHPRTTQIDDRLRWCFSRNIVERLCLRDRG